MKLRKKISVIIAGLMIMALIPQSVFAAQEPADEVVLSEDTAEEMSETAVEDMGEADGAQGLTEDKDDDVNADEEQIRDQDLKTGETEGQIPETEDVVEENGKTSDVTEPAEDDLDADGYTIDDFQYEDNSTGVTITGFKGQDIGTLNIPATLGNKPVTAIGYRAFDTCSGFSGLLQIPDSVTLIDSYAFGDCSGFTGLKLPAGLLTLESYAFSGCSGMKGTITIPSGVADMGSNIFEGCNGFTGLILSPGLIKLGSGSFTDLKNLAGSLVVPDSVVEIGSSCFTGCTGISSLKLGSGLETIGASAFHACSGIGGELIIPANVKSIGNNAFAACTSLTGLQLPQGLTEIGDSAFSECSSVKGKVVIPASVTSFGAHSFAKFGSGATLELCPGLREIGNGAFYNSGFKGEIRIPASMTSVADSAFSGSTGFTSLKLGSNLTTIGSRAFWGCSGLTGTLSVPERVTTIGDGAFYDCSSFTKLKLSDNLSTIGGDAFGGCTGIKTLTVPAGVTSISNSAFSEMYNVTKVVNRSSRDIRCDNFINNTGGGESVFVNSRTKARIGRDGALGKGTFTRKIIKLATPAINDIKNASKGINIVCSDVAGATRYVWLRTTNRNGRNWTRIASTKKPVYTDKNTSNGKVYYYKVYAKKGKIKSRESYAQDMCRIKAPKITSLKNSTAKSMTLKWSKVSSADGYYIFYTTDKTFETGQKTIKITGRNHTSKKITNLKKGEKYYVIVCAYKNNYGSYRSNIKSVKIKK